MKLVLVVLPRPMGRREPEITRAPVPSKFASAGLVVEANSSFAIFFFLLLRVTPLGHSREQHWLEIASLSDLV